MFVNISSLRLDKGEKILTEVWNSFESIYSHDYYKYRRTMEEDANNKDMANSVFYDYEKLLREECDCTKRIIPGIHFKSSINLFCILLKTRRSILGSVYPTNTNLS